MGVLRAFGATLPNTDLRKHYVRRIDVIYDQEHCGPSQWQSRTFQVRAARICCGSQEMVLCSLQDHAFGRCYKSMIRKATGIHQREGKSINREMSMLYNSADQLTLWPGMHSYLYDGNGALTHVKTADGTLTQQSFTYYPTGLMNTATFQGGSIDNVWDADERRVRFTVGRTSIRPPSTSRLAFLQ